MRPKRQRSQGSQLAKKPLFRGYGPALYVWSLAIGLGVLCLWLKGEAAFIRALWVDLGILETMTPRILMGMLLVGFLTVLIPKESIARALGAGSGIKGLAIAAGAGALLPGGPWVIMPLMLTVARSGADAGACVAFAIGWGTIGLNRFLVWEMPFFGLEMGGLRVLAALPLPIISGMLIRRYFPLIGPPEAPAAEREAG